MEISVDLVKALRDETGAGILACKEVLERTEGDYEQAVAILREQGLAVAAKKAARATHDGLIEAYVHPGSRVGAMVEVNCETDFVARTPEFRELAHDLAMQVAAMDPQYVSREDIPEGVVVNPEEACLLEQPFIKDPTRTILDLVNDMVAKVRENIRVSRLCRFSLGE